ncbi:MAG: preprotein translocase subunit SecA [Candidatus Omnitrophota bacterium]|nr:preprotein translocase subunit SecA [Candidatus Omnitrophota bacterium]
MFGFLMNLLKSMFGTQNERELRKLEPVVLEINALEEEFSSLSDDRIRERAGRIREEIRRARGEIKAEINAIREQVVASTSEQEKNKHRKRLKEAKNRVLDERIPEVFAAVREAARRTIGLRHFDVQLMGGIVLHQGKIAEMATGEGKTLVATLPVCLNTFSGETVYIITVNDYLAKRDSGWMGPVYEFLGLSVGVIQHDMRPEEKKKAYACDVVYGTNNEFGFDYLRDNMVIDKSDMVQGHPSFAIVDEVDSILIDEARTPLIISGPVDETNEAYNQMRPVIQEVVRAQKKTVADYISRFRETFRDGKEDEAGRMLYLLHKADPRNREFLDIILKDTRAKSLFDKAQSLHDSKVMEKERHELLEQLFYVFDEKSKEATFSAKGQALMREKFNLEFMLEDIEAKLAELAEAEEGVPMEEKVARETELVASYSDQQRKVESVKQLLKAYILFEKDVDYVIKDNKVVIVDTFTGRMMPGRRFSDGIHEAIEAKERVEVQRESQTLATITLQNYFRMFDKLAGMTGTAKTEEGEFENIYLLPVVQVPPNRPLKRESMADRIYKTEKEKFDAVIDEIADLHEKGRPQLVGTVSIEKSERLSKLLTTRGITHNVLNAKHHEKEAHIIAQAGRYGAVTIATNMAGRGTDILLGGNPEFLARDAVSKLEMDDPGEIEKALDRFLEEFNRKTEDEKQRVLEFGGLHVLGTERHEARRIDNQLRGRSGRQGDPGSSRFYLSLEDDLMRIFGSDRIKGVMDRLGMEEGEVIENPLVTRAVRTAQTRVEGQNFEIRKHLLKYDNVMNQQREVIYRRRRVILEETDLKKEFFESLTVGLESLLQNWETVPEPADFAKQVMYHFVINVKPDMLEGKRAEEVIDLVMGIAEKNYSAREKFLGEERMRELEKMVMLSVIDSNWKEYLREIDDLREGISWRAYAQKDPFIEFQHEGFKMFTELMVKIDEQTAERVMKISAMEEQYRKSVFQPEKETLEHRGYSAIGTPAAGQDEIYDKSPVKGPEEMFVPEAPPERRQDATYRRSTPKVGRNDPCPCGSGKKYKKCCGR